MPHNIVDRRAPQVAFGNDTWRQGAVRNVEAEVVDELGIRVVGDDDAGGTVESADEAGEACASTEFEDGFVSDEGRRVGFEVGGGCAAGVPEVVALGGVSGWSLIGNDVF
jgi:hypothetical protein